MMRNDRPPGIPDEEFIKEDSPMTKEEVRAITISKAKIQRNSVVYDVGAGVGSLTVEAALLADEGVVYSVERNTERTYLIRSNIEKFGVQNVKIVAGEAPEVLEGLPSADRILIGGSGGKLKEILGICLEKLKKGGIIIINAVTFDTLMEATRALEKEGLEPDITQVGIAKFESYAPRTLRAQNPVFVIRGVK